MKLTIRRYGVYGFVGALILFQITFLVGKNVDYHVQETLGYLTIVMALLFVFFAIKYYRDKENSGFLSLKEGVIIGLAITFFVAMGSAIADYLYVTVWYPDFISDYSTFQLEKLEATSSPKEFEVEKRELLNRLKTIGRPEVMSLIMFATVLLIGIIITLLSSLFLQKRRVAA